MNLYIRYFDIEALVKSFDEAMSFLESIEEITVNERIAEEVKEYMESDVRYPKRYKVRPRVYFIMIKTDAQSMADFKAHRTAPVENANTENALTPKEIRQRENDIIMTRLTTKRYGWYEAEVYFKRVVRHPDTGKNEYRDTTFKANLKAGSGEECYKRVIAHLSNRVDSRSQFPSIKGQNFRFKFLGLCKPVNKSATIE